MHNAMRTSRISRDTSRILAASRTQRVSRQTRSSANATTRDVIPKWIGDGLEDDGVPVTSESESSVIPADSDADEDGRPPKKRKMAPNTPVAVKHKRPDVSIAMIASPHKDKKPKKACRAPAKKITGQNGSVKIEPPANWEEIYALTRRMRNGNLAPVDTMGCESLADRKRTPRDQRFQTLIALMLSSQTKDTVTAVAMRGMQENMPGVRFTREMSTQR